MEPASNQPNDALHDVEAEIACLATVLLNEEAAVRVLSGLQPDDFYVEVHQHIVAAAKVLLDANREINRVSLLATIRKTPEAAAKVGPSQLTSITKHFPSVEGVDAYIHFVKACSSRRRCLRFTMELSQKLRDPAVNPIAAAQDNARQILDLLSCQEFQEHWSLESLNAFEFWFENKDNPYAFPRWPLRDLDQILGPMRGNEFIVVGANTGMGKSTLLLQAAMKQAQAGFPVLFITAEMTVEQMGERIVRFERFKDPRLLPLEDFSETIAKWKDRPLTILGTNKLTEIEAAIRMGVLNQKLKVVYVDYIGMISPPPVRTQETTEARVGRVSKTLARLPKDLGVNIVAACQFKRGSTGYPTLSYFRDSGQIEEDADRAILLYRPTTGDRKYHDHIRADVAKNRHGRSGVADICWNHEKGFFYDPDLVRERNE